MFCHNRQSCRVTVTVSSRRVIGSAVGFASATAIPVIQVPESQERFETPVVSRREESTAA